jgi:hypothetical protein
MPHCNIRAVKAYRNLAGVALSHGPEEVVGKSVLTEKSKSLIVDLVGRDVGYGRYNVSYSG